MPAKKSVQQEDIIQMNELYLTLKTYAAVARKVGFSPTTVKKYINTTFVSQGDINIVKFSGVIKDTKTIKLPSSDEDWNLFLRLSEEEEKECDELRKEILL